jgi:hypothetical protein
LRRLTASYTVGFEVQESLADSGFSDPAAFEAGIQSEVQTAVSSGTLAADIVANGGSSVVVPPQSVAVVIVTKTPTMMPYPAPTPHPVPAPTKAPVTPTAAPVAGGGPAPAPARGGGGKKKVDSASTSTIVLAVVLSLVGCIVCVGGGVVVLRRREASFKNQFASDYKLEAETWDEKSVPFGGGGSTRSSRSQTAAFDDYGAEMTERASGMFGGEADRMSTNPLANFLSAGSAPVPSESSQGGTNV